MWVASDADADADADAEMQVQVLKPKLAQVQTPQLSCVSFVSRRPTLRVVDLRAYAATPCSRACAVTTGISVIVPIILRHDLGVEVDGFDWRVIGSAQFLRDLEEFLLPEVYSHWERAAGGIATAGHTHAVGG